MERKYKQKEKTEEEHLKEIEKTSFETALEARRTLDSVTRTTERTTAVLYEQREKLEEIHSESSRIRENVQRGKDLSVKMRRAGKLITVGDVLGDKIKGMFKGAEEQQEKYAAKEAGERREKEFLSLPEIEDEPTEDSTNKVLVSIRDGLKDLRSRLQAQNEEINDQIPLIQNITKTNKGSTTEAEKIMKNLKKM